MPEKSSLSLQLMLGALGVVFGDIATSPLYALQIALENCPLNTYSILGVLSLIFWTLVLVICIKYVLIVFKADNNGEGGILALLALLKQKKSKYQPLFYVFAIIGSGLLLGDAMLTPAISVVSAIEGINTIWPYLGHQVLPIACGVLLLLFLLQSKGTAKIGAVFGPLIFIWLLVLSILGVWQIIQMPAVLYALNPYYAGHFLWVGGWHAYVLLGGIFLVVTGGEALYADIGHFGVGPIRYSWFLWVFPALVLNYFGQGAFLLSHPQGIDNPFYLMAPNFFKIPLLGLATCATIIASQAVISATFSLTKQAILLGLCPRFPLIHTSAEHEGQIYVPHLNIIMCLGTLFLLLAFKDSMHLAHAYGIAVNMYMLLITLMVSYTAFHVWNWSLPWTVSTFIPFIVIDLAFLGANSHKFLTGGWVPVFFALIVAFIMYTWTLGLNYLQKHFYFKQEDMAKILRQLNYKALNHLKGLTSIFITDTYDRSGGSFLHFLKLSMAVPEHVLIVSYVVENIPRVHYTKRYEVACLTKTVCSLTLHYGFMDTVSIPKALLYASKAHILPFDVNVHTASYIVEVPNVLASKRKRSLLFYLQEKLFTFLMRNYSTNLNIEFYGLPHNRTIAIGAYCLL